MAKRTGKRYKGGSAARDFDLFTPDLPFFTINPQLIKAHAVSDKTLHTEYTRLRAIANKRLKRMAASPLAQETAANNPSAFPKLTELKSREDVVRELINVSDFLTAKRGSLSGIKRSNKQTVKKFKEQGIQLNPNELSQYGRFINFVKKAMGLKKGGYDVKYIADVWDEMKTKGKITKRDFAEQMRELQKSFADDANRQITKKDVRNATLSTFFSESDLDARTLSGDRRKRRNR